MRSRTLAALTLALLAGAASQTVAQEHPRDGGGDRSETRDHEPRGPANGQPRGPWEAPRGGRGDARNLPPAAVAPPPVAPSPVAPPPVGAPRERPPLQSPQDGHARFGAPPPSGEISRGGGSSGQRLSPEQGHGRGAEQVRGPERNREVNRGGGEHGWDRPHDADRGRALEHARGDPRWDQDHQDGRPYQDGRDHRGGRRDDHDRDRSHGDAPRWERGRYPPVYAAPRRFHIAPYRQPYGFYARNWGFGDILPRGWYGDSYWLDDFWGFDLPYPPPGYAWVRVGDDALMIDRFNGRIVQVVRGIFW